MKTIELIKSGIPALSIRQPWAWAILHAGKDIENRSWKTNYRGPVLIHSSKAKPTRLELERFGYTLGIIMESVSLGKPLAPLDSIPFGGIVGIAEIIDCVLYSESPWFFGRYRFVLRNPRALPFAQCKGRQGFFKPEIEQ